MTRDADPRISVILPAYDVAPYVAEAVRSVAAQTWPSLELLAVDDGSTDDTAAVLERELAAFRRPGRSAELIRKSNGGLGSARNAGLERATGPLTLFLDGDDALDPDVATTLAGVLLAQPETCLVFPAYRRVDPSGRDLGTIAPAPARPLDAQDVLLANPIETDTGVLTWTDALRDAGGFDAALPSAVGVDMWSRLSRQGWDGRSAIRQAPGATVSYRHRGDQVTANWRRFHLGWQTVRERACDAGHLDRTVYGRVHARMLFGWAAAAYRDGEPAAARRFVREALALHPRAAFVGVGRGRRLLAAAAALLPVGVHDRLAERYARTGRRHAPPGGAPGSDA